MRHPVRLPPLFASCGSSVVFSPRALIWRRQRAAVPSSFFPPAFLVRPIRPEGRSSGGGGDVGRHEAVWSERCGLSGVRSLHIREVTSSILACGLLYPARGPFSARRPNRRPKGESVATGREQTARKGESVATGREQTASSQQREKRWLV